MKKKRSNFHFDEIIPNAHGSISSRKASRSSQNRSSNTNVVTSNKNSTKAKLDAKFEVSEGKIVLDLPLRTKSEANCSEHWSVKHKRHKSQQALVASVLKPLRHKITLPCKLLFTRFAPSKLDKHDNLPMSFKYIVDACCAIITGNFTAGQADSDERISIAYDQIDSKKYGIRIEVVF